MKVGDSTKTVAQPPTFPLHHLSASFAARTKEETTWAGDPDRRALTIVG